MKKKNKKLVLCSFLPTYLVTLPVCVYVLAFCVPFTPTYAMTQLLLLQLSEWTYDKLTQEEKKHGSLFPFHFRV